LIRPVAIVEIAFRREKTRRLLANKRGGQKIFDLIKTGGRDDVTNSQDAPLSLIQRVMAIVDYQPRRQFLSDGAKLIRRADNDHPAIKHGSLNRHLVDRGDSVLVGQQHDRYRFMMMTFQRAGEVKSREIAVNKRNISAFS